MEKLRIYLDTSVINFLFADDSPEKKSVTEEFFEKFVKTGIYNTFISDVVLAEIGATKDEKKRARLLDVVAKYKLDQVQIQFSEEIRLLASTYIEEGIIPGNKEADALHIAISTVNKMDVLLSWNYRHIANVVKERRVTAENLLLNFSHPLRIVTPLELIGVEDE